MGKLIEDRSELLEWVERNPSILNDASEELRKDKELMLQILRNNPANTRCIEYMAETFKADESFIVQAINISSSLNILGYASEELRNNKEFMQQMIELHTTAAYYMSDTLKQDRDFILQNIKRSPEILHFVDNGLKKDREIVLAAIENNPFALFNADDILKNDKKMVLAAMVKKPDALKFAGSEIKRDTEFLLKIARMIRTDEAIAAIMTFAEFKDEEDEEKFFKEIEGIELEIYEEKRARNKEDKQMQNEEVPNQESITENEKIEEPKKKGIKQKIVEFLENKKILRKIPFINNFILKEQGKLLPEGNKQLEENTARKQFKEQISNNGEYQKLSEQPLEIVDNSKESNQKNVEGR